MVDEEGSAKIFALPYSWVRKRRHDYDKAGNSERPAGAKCAASEVGRSHCLYRLGLVKGRVTLTVGEGPAAKHGANKQGERVIIGTARCGSGVEVERGLSGTTLWTRPVKTRRLFNNFGRGPDFWLSSRRYRGRPGEGHP